MADENLTLFLHCFTKGHDALQITAIHVLTDILTTHPSLLSAQEADENFKKSILRIFAKGIKSQRTPEVQSAAVIALCKLMLTSVISDEDLLKHLVICYFDPSTRDNPGVRQALSYFLPAYCHSRRENMERMATVAAGVMHAVVELSEELEEGEDMVGLGVVGNMLVDWTDARKLVIQGETAIGWDEAGRKEVKAVDGDIHLDLADSLLERAMNHACSSKRASALIALTMLTQHTGEDKKALIAMLGKLCITANSSAEKLQSTTTLVVEAIDGKAADDAASRNALNKLHLALGKAIGEAGMAKKSLKDTLAEDGLTSVGYQDGDELRLHRDQNIKMEVIPEIDCVTKAEDSLLEELLDDDKDL